MPDKDAPEVVMGGGLASSSKAPLFELIPTESMIRLATRFEAGIERKKEKAWNALSSNQVVLLDQKFVMNRITHVIAHSLKLRDKLFAGAILIGDGETEADDDAGAIMWGGSFLCCATRAIQNSRK